MVEIAFLIIAIALAAFLIALSKKLKKQLRFFVQILT